MNRDRKKPEVAQRDLDYKISFDLMTNTSDEQGLFTQKIKL